MAKEKFDYPGVVILPYDDKEKLLRRISADTLAAASVVLKENENGDLIVIKNRYGPIGDKPTKKELTLFMLRVSS